MLTSLKRVFVTFLILILPMSSALCIDMYLPAYGVIAKNFHVSESLVNLSLGTYLMGLALGLLIYGPLSDQYGRKRMLLIGLSIFTVASILCALATNIDVFVVSRLLQAIGACSALSLSRAIVIDIYPENKRAGMMAFISATNIFSPMLAPMLGGYLVTWFGWRFIFWSISLFGMLMWSLVKLFLDETLKPQYRQQISPARLLNNARLLFTNTLFLGYIIGIAALSATVFIWVSNSPLLLMNLFQIEPDNFGHFFVIPALGYCSGALVVARLSVIYPQQRLIAIGYSIILTASSYLVLRHHFFEFNSALQFVVPILFIFFGMGLAQPLQIASAMSPFKEIAGFTAGIIGFFQTSASCLVALLSTEMKQSYILETADFMAATVLLAALGFLFVHRRQKIKDAELVLG